MASLSADALAARVEAQRMRNHSRALRFVVQGNLERSREHLVTVKIQGDRARASGSEPVPSPWSGLAWTATYETLDRALVPVD